MIKLPGCVLGALLCIVPGVGKGDRVTLAHLS